MGMAMGKQANGCTLSLLADDQAQEFANDYDGTGIPDSDVFGLLVNPNDPNQLLVVDAGANTVMEFNANTGAFMSAVVIPKVDRPCFPDGVGFCLGVPFTCCSNNPGGVSYQSQAVPTKILARPGYPNELYLTQLTGALWSSDQANVMKLSAHPFAMVDHDFVSGFNSIISATFDGPKRLYVLEQNFFGVAASITGSNRLTWVDMATKAKTVVPTNLDFASHILMWNGVMYASNHALSTVFPCTGAVAKANIYATLEGCPCSQATPCYDSVSGGCAAANPQGKCMGTRADVCGYLA